MKKLSFIFGILLITSTASNAACNIYDLNCNPSNEGITYNLNRGYEQHQIILLRERASLRFGDGLWDSNNFMSRRKGEFHNWFFDNDWINRLKKYNFISPIGCLPWDYYCDQQKNDSNLFEKEELVLW